MPTTRRAYKQQLDEEVKEKTNRAQGHAARNRRARALGEVSIAAENRFKKVSQGQDVKEWLRNTSEGAAVAGPSRRVAASGGSRSGIQGKDTDHDQGYGLGSEIEHDTRLIGQGARAKGKRVARIGEKRTVSFVDPGSSDISQTGDDQEQLWRGQHAGNPIDLTQEEQETQSHQLLPPGVQSETPILPQWRLAPSLPAVHDFDPFRTHGQSFLPVIDATIEVNFHLCGPFDPNCLYSRYLKCIAPATMNVSELFDGYFEHRGVQPLPGQDFRFREILLTVPKEETFTGYNFDYSAAKSSTVRLQSTTWMRYQVKRIYFLCMEIRREQDPESEDEPRAYEEGNKTNMTVKRLSPEYLREQQSSHEKRDPLMRKERGGRRLGRPNQERKKPVLGKVVAYQASSLQETNSGLQIPGRMVQDLESFSSDSSVTNYGSDTEVFTPRPTPPHPTAQNNRYRIAGKILLRGAGNSQTP